MIDARGMMTAIVIGTLIALMVREVGQFGLAIEHWTIRGRGVGEALVTGALIGAATSLTGSATGRSRGRR